MNKKIKLSLILGGVVLLILVGGLTWWLVSQSNSQTAVNTQQSSNASAETTSTAAKNDVDWDSLPTTNVTLGDVDLTITDAGTYVLTGNTTRQVKVNSSGNVRIILKNATIKSASGPAIYVQNANKVVIQVASGTTNTVEDSAQGNDANGVIYSNGDMIIEGEGRLTISGKVENGIVAKNLTVAASNLTLSVTDKAIDITNTLTIDGGSIEVTASQEGMEAAQIIINGGVIKIYASDDGINAASDDTANIYIKITGGEINVSVADGDTDALDANGSIYVSGGTLTITARVSAFDFDGTAEFTGGSITVNGQKITTIENSMQGRPQR